MEQRKTNIVNWVNDMTNEGLLNRLEELKQESQTKIAKEIISLLDTSNAVDQSELTEHTSVRDLLNTK